MAFSDWSTTAGSNTAVGGVSLAEGMNPSDVNNAVRAVMADAKAALGTKGADIASATTTDLGAVAGLFHDITGTTTITGFGTIGAGIWKVIKFEDALTLTHNATSLIIPGGANITTANGDIAIVTSEGSGNWRVVTYIQAAGAPVVATQALMEAGASLVSTVTPGRAHYHPGVAKAWVYFSVSGGSVTVEKSYNVTDVTRNAEGDFTVTIATDFADGEYCSIATAGTDTTNTGIWCSTYGAPAAGSFRFQTSTWSTNRALVDPLYCSVLFFGDHA